ncbi:MAG: DUF935 family protein [Armatimonadota bacterium]|nr:DUF935 domain-containing protein [Armatimonadota bacterium]MDW8143959.1 DUF935 family protein [Armatimonadota bacterium]
MRWAFWKRKKFAQQPKDIVREELGFGGYGLGALLSNLAADEYLPKLSFPNNISVYTQMRRSDATVQTLELAITLPIRATDWRIDPASDSPSAREAADLIESNLFGGMTITFDDFLREALLALFYGFVVFEKVFEERDGYIVWRKFASRHPQTIDKFLFDETGGLAGIVQIGFDPQGRYRRVEIPVAKLLVFIWRKEFGNPYGVSVLRAAYKHWFLKDLFYKLHAIALERWAVGVPWGKVPPGTSETDKNIFMQLLENLRSHEKAAIVTPSDYDIQILGAQEGSRAAQAFMDAINHQDTMIIKSVLAQFLNLGQGNVGSWALSKDHSQLFLMTLNSVAQWFADTINRYAIPQLCRFNFGDDFSEFPELTFTDLRLVLQREEIAETISKLAQTAVITADPELQKWVREMLDLPEMPEVEEEVSLPAPETTSERRKIIANNANNNGHKFSDPFGLQQGASLRALSDRVMVEAEQDLQTITRQMIDSVMEQVRQLVQRADSGQPSALREVGNIQVPSHLSERYELALYGYLTNAYKAARTVYLAATGTNPTKPPRWVDFYLHGWAKAIATQHCADLAATAAYETLRHYEISKNLGQKFSEEMVEAALVNRMANELESLPKEVEALTETLFEPIEVNE